MNTNSKTAHFEHMPTSSYCCFSATITSTQCKMLYLLLWSPLYSGQFTKQIAFNNLINPLGISYTIQALTQPPERSLKHMVHGKINMLWSNMA